MVRSVGVVIGMVVLCVLTFGLASASDNEGAHQTILPLSHTDGLVTTVYTVTNAGGAIAIYAPGFYLGTGEGGPFPYRLVFQVGSQALNPGTSDSFSTAHYASLWTEPADTLIINSSHPLSITHVVVNTPHYPQHSVWLPIYTKWEPGPAPGIAPDIYEYKFVKEGKCHPEWIDGDWIPVCDEDEVRYEITVVTPMDVRAMWMLRPGDEENGESVQMWRSAAAEVGYVKFRPGFSGSVTAVPVEMEYTIGSEIYVDAYDVDCAWTEGTGQPSCWTIANPD